MRRLVLLSTLFTLPLFAHEAGEAAIQTSAEQFWNGVTAIVLAVVAVLYVRGLLRLWSTEGGHLTVRRWQALAFGIGWAGAAIALLSELDAVSDILFSAHMVQHEILMLISAPLMVLGRPWVATLWALSPRQRAAVGTQMRRPLLVAVWERLTGPVFVLVLHAVVLWAWHVPALFEAALHNEPIHVVQHLSFFCTAALFWWALVHGRFGRIGYGAGVMYVFVTAMSTQTLGVLLTFGHHPWYPTHAARTGIHALEDQQLAGIVMWVPFGVVFVLIGLALFAAWLGEAERRVAFTTAGKLVVVIAFAAALLSSGCHSQDDKTARQLTTGGDPARGRVAIAKYGCGTCHTIPGVGSASGLVGPPLAGIADRTYLAGQLMNQPDNMMKWIRFPQEASPGSAMPDMNVTERDARDIAAYLYTLRAE